MLIEYRLNAWNKNIVRELPEEGIHIIEPKHFDGMQMVQVFIDFAEVVTPPAITAVCTYLVTIKKEPTVIIKADSDNNFEIEIKGRLEDKKIKKNLLYKNLLQLMQLQIKEKRKDDSNTGTIH